LENTFSGAIVVCLTHSPRMELATEFHNMQTKTIRRVSFREMVDSDVILVERLENGDLY